MTLVPVLAPSWVTIDLDTTPPLLVVDAPSHVEPPDPWIVIVRANEDLGPAGMEYLDAYGTAHSIGFERIGLRTLAATIPTDSLSGGVGELKVVVADQACNPTTVLVPVTIKRPRAYDAEMTISQAYQVETTVSTPFEATVDIEHSHAAQRSLDHAFEADSEITPSITADLEITDG